MVFTTPLNACILSAKNAHALVHARICNGAETSLPGNYCELVLSLARASYRLSFAARPAAHPTTVYPTGHPLCSQALSGIHPQSHRSPCAFTGMHLQSHWALCADTGIHPQTNPQSKCPPQPFPPIPGSLF